MGQILHGSAKTTHAVRAAIQRSKASIQELASRYDLNPKTVMKWRKRAFLYDAPMGPKVPRSTVLSAEEEALERRLSRPIRAREAQADKFFKECIEIADAATQENCNVARLRVD